MNKKKWEQLKRELAEEEAKAPAESQSRQEEIKVLWQDLQDLKQAKPDRARELAEDELGATLIELVEKQKSEIKYLTKFRRDWERILARYPKELENLNWASLHAEYMELAERLPKPNPKKVYEWKRRRYKRGDVGEIELQFGGGASSVADCLDDIFAFHRVNMVRLQELFRMNRNRFPEELPSFEAGRETLYNYGAVVKIMEALLSEPGERKKPARGRRRRLWLSDPDLRTRVLNGIEGRIMSTATELREAVEIDLDKADQDKVCQFWQKEIADPFLAVVRRHRRSFQ